MSLDEFARIELLRRIFESGAPPSAVVLGIGDDAAVLAPSVEPVVVSIDASVEGVHFRRDLLEARDIGYRATMAALSDLAAMGAAPSGVVVGLVLPTWVDDAALAQLAEGQRDAAVEVGTAIIGGNLARGGELSLTTTVLGHAPSPLRREGARSGDVVAMAGVVGLAAAGLALLTRRAGAAAPDAAPAPSAQAAIDAWRRPRARIADGLRARGAAHAAIDVSDGLARDVGHMARASDVRIVLDAVLVRTPELDAVAAELGRDPLDLALGGGEDYALVIALPPGMSVPGFHPIGAVEDRVDGGEVLCAMPDGRRFSVGDRGFDHFR